MEEENLFERVRELEAVLEAAIHDLSEEPGLRDIRNIGLTAAIDLEPWPEPGARARAIFERGLREGILLRFTGDTIAMGPPFISTPDEIRTMVGKVRDLIRAET